MTSHEIRRQFTRFFEARGHQVMPPSSLVPEGDSSVLFTTAGMQQFKPFYTEPDLAPGARLTSIQPSLRTSDIEEVGDNRHLTLFEMLGNFSFGYTGSNQEDGAYFKAQAIEYAYDFLIKTLEINPERVYVTVYEGKPGVPKDEESAKLWFSHGITDIRYEGDDNFWGPTGDEGPCGPTTEIYVDGIEVWNLVFNQYFCDANGNLSPLKSQGVDTGSGLERVAAVMQGKTEVFETDLFAPFIETIKQLAGEKYVERSARIIVDHLKASLFLLKDGVLPSNKAQGYILRRLIRRMMVNAHLLGLEGDWLNELTDQIIDTYSNDYPGLLEKQAAIKDSLSIETGKFSRTLNHGLKEYEKIKLDSTNNLIDGAKAFHLFDTFGFPIELTAELAAKDDLTIDRADFDNRFKTHQETSRSGSEQIFKGGLADHEPQTIKHHTAHHLLLAALRQVLGQHVYQRGSNVTAERLRIDFSHGEKVTAEQLAEVEAIVNQAIADDLTVAKQEMPKAEADQLGALAEFGQKYGETVSIYTIFNQDGSVLSREFCGGPHVNHTGELGHFTILKEEASSAGVRRIKAKVS